MDINFNKNEDHNKLLLSELNKQLSKVKLGGGKSKIEKLHKQGKLTARERINYLLDAGRQSIEIAAFAGDNMYEEHGGCPSGGVVVKIVITDCAKIDSTLNYFKCWFFTTKGTCFSSEG